MDPLFYKSLEYSKIISMLVSKAITPMGKVCAENIIPSVSLDEVQILQNQTTTAVDMILKKGPLPLGGAKDITQSLDRATRGGILNIKEVLYVGDFIHVSKRLKNYFKSENKDDIFPLLEDFFSEIFVPTSLEKVINLSILNETELKDDASSNLLEIRKNIKQSNAKIKEQLNNIIHSSKYKNMLQDAVVTIRSGRYCVPVKQEYKGSFGGIVHDQSATGVTVFVEPLSVVNLNNKIKELVLKENEEINEILKKISTMIANEEVILKNNLKFITLLDTIFAKGELSLEMEAVPPKINDDRFISIVKGRHPLINKGVVVPLDINIGNGFNTLLITGPNTGGKTVALKTLGLFTIMAQAGLHLPAQSCEVCIFQNVFADIGDEQSIEQSLSTFSAHMSNIVKILKFADKNSLILLDELGAGTDPTEGAAIAISIIEYFHKNKIMVAVTTHFSQLKIYALSTEGVENASCEFDINTLAPTYKLLIGVPGKSNAFAISKKLGLPENILEFAKGFINSQEVKLEDIIADLEINKKTVQIEQERAATYREEVQLLRQELNDHNKKIKEQKEKILKKAKEEAKQTLRAAEETANTIIKEMVAKSKELNLHEMDKMRKVITKKIDKLTPTIKEYKPLKKVKLGDRVFIRTLNQSGIVSTLPDNNGEVTVKIGIMKIKVPLTNLLLDTSEEITKKTSEIKSVIKSQKVKSISTSLDIRGHLVEEGLSAISKYLDDAYLSNLKQVTIIHGKGSGVLRKAVQAFLSKSLHVKSYRIGEFGEGDSGVTIVEIK